MLFGREPALLLAVIAGVVQLGSARGLNLTGDQQGYVNMAVAAIAGAIVAFKVSAEKGVAALAAVASTLMAAVAAFGVNLDAATQSSVMVAVSAVIAFWLRGQVEAPVPTDMAPAARAGEHQL